jgi:outer membrane lipopolysaccharide assembly protein LptE/RlpB
MSRAPLALTSLVRLTAFASLAAMFSLAGCGYQFQGSGSILPEDVKTIAIAPVENDTTIAGLGVRFGDELRSRFERYGVVRIIEDRGIADAILSARILNVDTQVRNVSGAEDIALDEELFITVAAELRRKSGQLLYRDPSMTVSDSFASVSDVVVTSSAGFASSDISASELSNLTQREVSRGQQEQALDELMEEVARKIYLNAVAAEF